MQAAFVYLFIFLLRFIYIARIKRMMKHIGVTHVFGVLPQCRPRTFSDHTTQRRRVAPIPHTYIRKPCKRELKIKINTTCRTQRPDDDDIIVVLTYIIPVSVEQKNK